MNTTTAPAFRVLGTTNDVTECEHCGRTELRGTIVLLPLDADGNADAEPVYYGAVCGARAAGTKTADLRKAATAADKAKAEVERIERQREADKHYAAVRRTYGTAECYSAPTMCRIERKGACVAHPLAAA